MYGARDSFPIPLYIISGCGKGCGKSSCCKSEGVLVFRMRDCVVEVLPVGESIISDAVG